MSKPSSLSRDARWFFRRKSGYMSEYLFRTMVHIVVTYPRRGLPLDPVYVRVGRRYFKVWGGTKK